LQKIKKTRILPVSAFDQQNKVNPLDSKSHTLNTMEAVTLENEYAYIKDGKVFLKGYLDMPDRQIGEVKRTEEEAFQYFVNRYQIAINKVNQLESEIAEAQNKGSYLTKLMQLRKRLLNFDGIGDFIPLLNKLDELETYLRSLIVDNQANNLTIKRDLINEAKEAVEEIDWKIVADNLQEIKTRWIRTGPVEKPLNDELEAEFREILDGFYQKRKAFYDEMNRVIDERIAKYEELTKGAEMLFRMGDWEASFKELKRLQTEWKNVGDVPPKKLKFLFRRFKKLTTTYYEKYCNAKGIKIVQRVDPRVEAQRKMMEEAEALAAQKDIFAAAERAKVMLNDWKNIKVPANLAERNVAERFRGACDKIFELSYLMKVVTRKVPNYNYLSDKQQTLTKFREMESIVIRARGELKQLIESYDGVARNEEMDKIMNSNINTQKRKLLMKEVILEELRRAAANA